LIRWQEHNSYHLSRFRLKPVSPGKNDSRPAHVGGNLYIPDEKSGGDKYSQQEP